MLAHVQRLWNHLTPSLYSLLLSVPILIFLRYYIVNRHMAYWRLSAIILLLGLFFILTKRYIKPNWQLCIFCLSGFVVYIVNYHVLGKLNVIPEQDYDYYRRIADKYILYLPFMLLPTVFFYSEFKAKHFFNLLLLAAVYLLVFVNYHDIKLAFNRELLAEHFDPIISYDIGAMTVGIMLLCYAFFVPGKWGYCLLVIACLSLFTIILHGSRGTWIGLPLVLLILCWQYFKHQKNKCVWMLGLFTVFLSINMAIPNSPIMNRVNRLQAEYQKISQYSYNNSSGVRLMLWQNSLHLFRSSPLTGVGMYGIQQQNCDLKEQNILPVCFQHQHSIVFQEMAANGVLGLLGLFFSFIIPIGFFIRHLHHKDDLTRNLSIGGTCLLIYFFCSGLTEYYLFFADVTYWFYFSVASLMSFVHLNSKRLSYS